MMRGSNYPHDPLLRPSCSIKLLRKFAVGFGATCDGGYDRTQTLSAAQTFHVRMNDYIFTHIELSHLTLAVVSKHFIVDVAMGIEV
jgi:hypothetical protein